MADTPLTPEQEAEAQHIYELLQQTFLDEARRFARLLASKPDRQQLGRTEVEVRDPFHRLAATALQTARNERKKGATRVPAGPARTASRTPAARASAPARSSDCWGPCAWGGTLTTARTAARAPARATACSGCGRTTGRPPPTRPSGTPTGPILPTYKNAYPQEFIFATVKESPLELHLCSEAQREWLTEITKSSRSLQSIRTIVSASPGTRWGGMAARRVADDRLRPQDLRLNHISLLAVVGWAEAGAGEFDVEKQTGGYFA